MRRILIVAVCLLALAGAGTAYAKLAFMRGGFSVALPAAITGITVAGQTSLTFTSTSGDNPVNLGNARPTASDGSTPGLAIGTNSRCTSSSDNSKASLSGGNLEFTDPTPGTVGGPWHICLVATGAGYLNSPYGQTITVSSTSVRITSVALSNASFTGGVAGTVGTLSATLSSGTFSGSFVLATGGTDHSGTACNNYGSDFAVAGGTLTNSTGAAAQSYPGVCVTARQSGLASYTQAFTLNGSSCSGPAAACAGCFVANGGGPNNGSCLNTLALNLDFTGATTSSAPPINNSFDATNLANVIDCKGANPPVLMSITANLPCADDSIVTDSNGNTAFQQQYTYQDYLNGVGAGGSPDYTNNLVSTIQGGSNGNGPAFGPGQPGTYPEGYYFEARLSVLTTGNPNPGGGGNGCGNCLAGGPWVWGGYASSYTEEDFDEWYLPWERQVIQNLTYAGGGVVYSSWNNNGGSNSYHIESQLNSNPNQWYTIGLRKTVNGTTAELCGYFNNVQFDCGTETDNTSTPFAARPGLVLWAGDAYNNNNGAPEPYGTMIFQYEWIHMWTCATWWQKNGTTVDGTGCNGALISSNP